MGREFLTEFTFDNYGCRCEIEKVVDEKSGDLKNRLVIQIDKNKTIPLSYEYGSGLKLTYDRTVKKKNNLLGEFLGIKKDDLNEFKSYFEKYGFLFKLSNTSGFFPVNMDDLLIMQDNLLAFIFLMNNQGNNINLINLQELLDGCLFLLFRNEKIISIGKEEVIKIPKNYLMTIIDGASYQEEDKHGIKYEKRNGQLVPFFEIEDCIDKDGFYKLDLANYQEIMTNDQIPQWFKNLIRVFKNKSQLVSDLQWHSSADFLVHLFLEFSAFYKTDIRLNGIFDDNLYRQLKKHNRMVDALKKLSKALIECEFKTILSNVTPTYNVDDMKPDWKLPSLYSAMYFSLFYLNSSEEGFRKCANSNCEDYFQVSKTNLKKKYCSWECGNADRQRKYQKRKQQR